MTSMIRSLVNTVRDTGDSTLAAVGVAPNHRSMIGELVKDALPVVAMGGALGMISGQRVGGLDSAYGAIDGWTALGLAAASCARAGHEDAEYEREGAKVAGGIFTFRQFEKFFQAKAAAAASTAPATAHGDYRSSGMNGQDPVLHAGAHL